MSNNDPFNWGGGGLESWGFPGPLKRYSLPRPQVTAEPIDIPIEPVAPEPEKTKPAVILKNPRWEVEKVGFLEETDISVEIEIPPEHARKTKVVFELFAKTPAGPERIVHGEGNAESGKAKCRVPVYIPNYKDEHGQSLQKVEYYFTAKHSESAKLDGSKSVKVVSEMAERLIESHILSDRTFATETSFFQPTHATALKELCRAVKAWREKHPDGKLAVFGHADAAGKEESKRTLSERRAEAAFGFLIKDVKVWEGLFKAEKWGLAPLQELLKHLGHDAGVVDGKDGPKTREAMAAFQTKHGLPADGSAGESTRAALFKTFMDRHNTLALNGKDFDDINGGPTAGCSDFNRVEKTDGACEVNLRVAVLLVKSTKKIPLNYPCQKGSSAPCKSQVAKKGARRTDGFDCHFYDTLVIEVPKRGSAVTATVIELGVFFDGTNNNRDSHRPLGYDSNVSKLFDLFDHDEKTRYKVYVEGVGSGSAIKSDPITGGFSGRGVNERIERAAAYVKSITDKHPGKEIRLSVFGFSRGAATALAFINHLFVPAPKPQTFSSAMGNPSNEKPTGPVNSPAASSPKPPFEKIWFAGLFDVVGSIGLPGDAQEFIHDLTARTSRIRHLTHLISRDERRALFPLTSVRSGPNAPLPPGWTEIPFPGVHSDVGGGYENMVNEKPLPSPDGGQDHTQVTASLKTDRRDYLSRVAGWAMFDAAKAAGLTMHSFERKEAAPLSPDKALKNMINGPVSHAETPENGWTTFHKPDAKEPRIKEALVLLSIHPSLLPLWSARLSESKLRQVMDFSHPDYSDHIAPYMHDSMGLMDPKGLGAVVGMNISSRTILYRGGK